MYFYIAVGSRENWYDTCSVEAYRTFAWYCAIEAVAVFLVFKFMFLFVRLKTQIPDIKTSLDIVKHMKSKKVEQHLLCIQYTLSDRSDL